MRAQTGLCMVVLAVAISLCAGEVEVHPLSDEFIGSINAKQSTWKAGRNFEIDTPAEFLRSLTGTFLRGDLPSELPLKVPSKVGVDVPESFDAREEWPDCANIIGDIRDQASCGSCWAFGAAEVMSDRICIASDAKTKVKISSEDINTCCDTCGFGCQGGWPEKAFAYWSKHGVVTGGAYKSNEGCKTYSIPPCEHHVIGELPACGKTVKTPTCKRVCDSSSPLTYNEDLTYGSAYTVRGEVDIQTEMMENGPVEASFTVYGDFLNYKSGVYQHVSGARSGGHAVKIIGWGVENNTKYWLIANSWNSDWGDKGYFKILRGQNECGIESEIAAGTPRL